MPDDQPTSIDKNSNSHTVRRPDWMTDAQWGEAVDRLGDLWNDLLRAAAETLADQQRHAAR